MLQGDQYSIDFTFKKDNLVVTGTDLLECEITIGKYTKGLSDGVNYSNSAWHFPLTQQETFALSARNQPVQARLKFTSGEVFGVDGGVINVKESISKEVL